MLQTAPTKLSRRCVESGFHCHTSDVEIEKTREVEVGMIKVMSNKVAISRRGQGLLAESI